MEKNKKVLIWGTGKICKQIEPYLNSVDILGYIETVKSKHTYNERRVYSPKECPKEYDLIVLAVSSAYHYSIYHICAINGIDKKRLCAVQASEFVTDTDYNLELADKIFLKEMYENICREFGRISDNWIEKDARQFDAMNTRESMRICEEYQYPIFHDKFGKAGSINSYFWQDLWGARKIFEDNPKMHYDIGSRIDGFISHLLSFRDNVTLIDIRPLDRNVEGLHFIQSDATNLENISDNSIESLSALCSLEHFGMGRYGDPIDPEACFKCFRAIAQKMKNGGHLYISVPVGREHIEFNAHRVFYASTIVKEFAEFELLEYSCTKDGFMEYNVELTKYDDDMSFGGTRFGLFHFRKK